MNLSYSYNIFHRAKVYIYICMKRFSEKNDKYNENGEPNKIIDKID